jgi:glycosyltransferase involved in cell wall biosynthesis
MKVLTVLNSFPYPILDGYKLREYHLIRNLSSKCEMTLICFKEKGNPIRDKGLFGTLFKEIKEVEMDIDGLNLLSLSEKMRFEINNEISLQKYDVVYLAGIILLPYFSQHWCVPIVVDAVDDESILIMDKMRLTRNPITKIRYLKWWLDYRKFAKRYVPLCRSIILTSVSDAKFFKSIARTSNVYVIPNGVDSDFFNKEAVKNTRNVPMLCFTGVMSFEPNYDAIIYFIKKIYGKIKKKYPEVGLKVIGRDPHPKLLEICKKDSSIEVTGYVEDIRGFLSECSIYVSPMRMGTGIKNKILEALAMSKAVVSTSKGCAGLEVTSEQNIIIRDRPEDFAKAVIELLRDEKRREFLGRNGRKLVEERYSWKTSGQLLESILMSSI